MKYKLRNHFSREPEYALQDILLDRGVKDIENYMYPTNRCELNPYDLDNIRAGANMLLRHLKENNKICLIVDPDTDGFTASAILWLYIKHIYPNAQLRFTVHTHKQHGLSDKINWLENQDFDLVIAPDAASYDVEEQNRLNLCGIDCLILDHHNQLYDDNDNPILPTAPHTIVINNQLSSAYENKTLCGAGVVFKFCEVLDDLLNIKVADNFLDLVALGEIADVMDRTNTETNYYITEGLAYIQNEGFRTLLAAQSFSLKEKATEPWPGLTAIDVAFYIAPLINALCRVGTVQEKETMFYCFVEPNRIVKSTKRGAKPDDTETAAEQTARVGANAKARQNKIKERAMDLIDFKIQKDQLYDNNIILVELNDEDDIPQEMTGLIAMAVVSKYGKPCMIGRRNSHDELQGSIRNNGNFAGLPSFKAFLENSGLMNYVAGHDNSAGWGLAGNKVDQLLNYANHQLDATAFENCYLVDYILDAREGYHDLLTQLASHPEYFGNHVDEIMIVLTNISLAHIMVMGQNKDCMKISYNNIDYVKFKDVDFIEQIQNNRDKTLTVVGKLNLNTFNGKTTTQVLINDYELISENKYEF